MSNWLTAQLKAAEGILEAVDRTVTKTVYKVDDEAELDANLPPLPDIYNAPGEPSSSQPTPYTQLHTSPFAGPDSGPFSAPLVRPPPYSTSFSSLQGQGPPSTGSFSVHSPTHLSTPPKQGSSTPQPASPSSTAVLPAGAAAAAAADAGSLPGSRPPAPLASSSLSSGKPSAVPSPLASASSTGNLLAEPSNAIAPTASPASAPQAEAAGPAAAPAPPSAPAPAPTPELDNPKGNKAMEQLKARVERLKYENRELEEMLANAEEQAKKEATAARLLQQQYARLAADKAASETAMEAAITAKSAELQRLALALEASQLQNTKLEALLAAAEESSRALVENKESLEGGMLEALRAQLAAAEQRLEAERKEHHGRQAAAARRQQDLEQQVADNGLALASLQRSQEELVGRCRELEEQLAMAQAARSKAEADLRAAEAAGSQAITPDGSNGHSSTMQQSAELAALRQQVSELRHSCQQLQQHRTAAESESAKLRQQVQELQQQGILHSSAAGRQPQPEQQLKEMSEMLYIKQMQLEKMAADKAAQQMMLERQIASYRDELARATRGGSSVGGAVEGRGSYELIPMDALGEPYQRLARHNKLGGAVQATARFLDTTAGTASLMLRQYPLVRLGVFVYIVLIHLYVYFLIAKMQRLALLSMGTGRHTLP